MPSPEEKYTPTQWSTSTDKSKFESQFKKFVTGGFKRRDFPKWFYQRLCGCFGFIAHYDEHQFYETFFTTPKDRRWFIDQTLKYVVVGDPAWTYSDVEKVLQDWMRKLHDNYDRQGDGNWPGAHSKKEVAHGRQ
jgi:hypothetical protein